MIPSGRTEIVIMAIVPDRPSSVKTVYITTKSGPSSTPIAYLDGIAEATSIAGEARQLQQSPSQASNSDHI